MSKSKFDAFYRSMILTKFFSKGWGEPKDLQRIFDFRKIISNREKVQNLIPKSHPVEILSETQTSDCKIIEGHFVTPLELHLPGIVPKAVQNAHFQLVLPNQWRDEDYKPVCLHLAGTGDHYFWRRRNLVAKPLMKEAGLGAIILENPFYGTRKPADQSASSLHNVSDLIVMGYCLFLEALVLFDWCEKMGLGPFGITGLSMGGHMASLAATNYPKPLVLVPCLSWSTASTVFTEGVMSHSVYWDVLGQQFLSDEKYKTKLSKMVTVLDDVNFLERISHSEEDKESLQFMRGMMDECTHLKNFSVPVDTDLIIAVCAKDDAYIPRDGCSSLEDIWPGAEVRYLDAGHVSAYVLHQKLFRSSIIEAFERSKQKWLAAKRGEGLKAIEFGTQTGSDVTQSA